MFSKLKFIFCFALVISLGFTFTLSDTAKAKVYLVGGKPLALQGFISQGIGYGLGGDEYDTKDGFQQAVFQFFFEQ